MMDALTILGFAIAAVVAGGAILALTYVGARMFSRAPAPFADTMPPIESTLVNANDAIVIARRGGQIVYVNDRAKQLFGLNGEEADLSRMARLAQPQDSFFDLFATEGQTTLTVANRPLEAVSVRVPGETAQFVVMLRESAGLTSPRGEGTPQTVAVLSEASKLITGSLDLEATINNILHAVARIVHYDLAEINLWDAEAQVLRPRARAGDRNYVLSVERSVQFYRPDEGYTGWIARNRRPLLITDTDRTGEVQPKVGRADFPFHSMLGVPLLAPRGEDRELVGTLEMVSVDLDAYSQQDIFLLETLGEQAAVAIRNAQLYAQQTARITELSGLAQLAQSLTVLTLADTRELYATLVDRIAKVMGVQLCGILIYDDAQRALISQSPFRGLPDMFVEMYRISVTPGTRAAKVWHDEEFWYSNNVSDDPLVAEMGLKELSETVGVRATLIVPLIVGGARLGVVQVSNKISSAPFTDDDARTLSLFAGQAAALIENARLVREAEERARRAEALREISEIAGSARSLEDIYREVVTRTAQLVQADLAVLVLLDETKGELAPQPGSVYGGTLADAKFARIRIDDPAFRFTITYTRKPFFAWRASRDWRISPLYRPALDHYKVESVIIVPLVVHDRSLGELQLGARRERAFQRADVPLLATVAAQLASAVERERLASVTDETLRRRIDQLTALTRVGRELNQTIELDHILQSVYDEAVRATGADCGSILLLDLNAAAPTARKRLGSDGADLTLDALEADIALSGASYIIPDVNAPNAFAILAVEGEPRAAHAGVRSLLAVPIISQGAIVGIVELHRRALNGFDKMMLDFSQALAAQAAIAVGNAQRYEEQLQRGELLRHRADQLAQLLQISRTVRSDHPLTTNLEAIAFGVQEAVGFGVVLISVLDPESNLLRRTAAAGVPISEFERLKQNPQPYVLYAAALRPEFRISQSYYIPRDRTPPELNQRDAITLARAPEKLDADHWHPGDFLFVPLMGSGGQTVGLMSLDDPRSGRRPDQMLMETVEIFANQAALAIENARLVEAAQSRAAELSRSLAELQKSYQDLDAVSRALTRKDAELSNLMAQTELRAKRLLALHRIAGATAEIRDETDLLQRTAEATVTEMNLDACLIALLDGGTLRLVARAGVMDPTSRLDEHLTTHNPLSQVIELRSPLLAPEVRQPGWGESRLIQSLQLRSFVSVPIFIAGRLSGAALVGSRLAHSPFTNEDIDIFITLSRQIGVGVENIQLYADVRERAAQLGALIEVSRVVSSALRQEDVVTLVLEQVGRVIPYDTATLWLRESHLLRVAGARGFENDEEQLGLIIQVEDSRLFKEMSETHLAILVGDTARDRRFPAGEISPTRSWLGAPLMSKGQVLGLLALDKVEAGFYTANHADLALAFANQAAAALDNARLFEESVQRAIQLNERSQRLALLNRISTELNRTLNPDRILEISVREMSSAMGRAQVAAVIYDEAAGIGRVQAEYPAHSIVVGEAVIPLAGNPLTERLRQLMSPVVIDDVQSSDMLLPPARERWLKANVKGMLIAPLIAGDQLLGNLTIDRGERERFRPGEIELAQTIANQTAIAIQNARRYDETQRLFSQVQNYALDLEKRVAERTEDLAKERDRVETLLRITNELSASLDLDRVLSRALALANDALGGTEGALYLLDPQAEYILYRAALGIVQQLPPGGRPAPFRRGEGLAGWVIKYREPVIVPDLSADERWLVKPLSEKAKSAICVPLISGEDALGAMIFYSDQPDAFNEDQLQLIAAAANQVTSAINNAELYRLIRDQAERLGGMLRANQVEASKSRAILESIADGVLVADPEGKIILFNATAERILKLNRADVLNRPVNDFMGLYGAGAKNLTDAMARWSSDPSSYQPGDYLSERIELEDKRIVSVLLAPVTTTDEFLGSVSIFRDITREVEVDRLKTEFVTTVSHELRTPMTAVKGYADLLLMGAAGEVTPDQQRFLDMIKSNAERLRTMLDDLLDISKLDSGRVELNLTPLNIADVIEAAADHVRDRVKSLNRPMNIVIKVEPDLPPLPGDLQRVTQIVANLADNAFNYTDPGGTITLSANRKEDAVVVSVADTGIGLTSEERARIFERFYRGENPLVMATAGAGLGLSIVQRLVAMHGGSIWVESEGPGRGSTFYVLLKLAG